MAEFADSLRLVWVSCFDVVGDFMVIGISLFLFGCSVIFLIGLAWVGLSALKDWMVHLFEMFTSKQKKGGDGK